MPLYTEDQLQEVTSWMEDEGRSVTIATVSQSLGLSRSQAQALLERLEERNGVSSFRVTIVEDDATSTPVPTTVFKLSQSNDSKDGYLYAVTGKESLKTAHERDMDQMREMLKNNQLDNLTTNAIDAIAPAEQVIPMMEHNSHSTDRPLVTSLDRTKPTKKATTAASFFQKKNETTKKTDAKKEISKENEKENKAKQVGSVDDFVGDEDDSDDDDDDPMEVEPRKKIIRGRKPRTEEKEPEPVVQEKEPALPVRGAMDDFATQAKQRSETCATGRRRRKKLVQKTSMDADGYLHTETQEVWEDIPSDEEDEPIFFPKKPTTTQTSTKKVALKQGSLMGFFTKKK